MEHLWMSLSTACYSDSLVCMGTGGEELTFLSLPNPHTYSRGNQKELGYSQGNQKELRFGRGREQDLKIQHQGHNSALLGKQNT